MTSNPMEKAAILYGVGQAQRVLEKRRRVSKKGVQAATAGILVAEGDSWFKYPGDDILNVLEDDFGYDVRKVSSAGDKAEEMAYQDGQLEEFTRVIEKLNESPAAILISAGGNDVAGEDTFGCFLHHVNSPNRGLIESVVTEAVDVKVRNAYITMISAVNEVCKQTFEGTVPILTHGYDYAVPDGRGWWWLGPWLEPGFREKGYADMEERKQIVEDLITRFNEMMGKLNKIKGFGNVSHLDLRGNLPNDDETYEKWWDNELHPEKIGFQKIGKLYADQLAKL